MKDIFPAHLVKMYDPATKVMKNEDNEADDEKYSNTWENTSKHNSIGEPLSRKPKFLRKRKHPKALRFYKPDQENNPVRYFLQELMLYTSYDEKTYDDWHDDELCIKAYLEKEEEIRVNKKQVIEWLEDVEESRHYVEEVLKN